MRRLYPRGDANAGVCVDADGAMLGPSEVLVERTSIGFRPAQFDRVAMLQRNLSATRDEPDWLFRQCERIADALNKGELALAQIYGLLISVDDAELKPSIALKAGFNPDEPRVPKGQPHAGEWTTGGGQEADEQVAVPMNRNKDDCIQYCMEATARIRDLGSDPFWACLRACQGRFPNPLFPEFDSHFG